MPKDKVLRCALLLGEQRFGDVGCVDCHEPFVSLASPVFGEPNPLPVRFPELPEPVRRSQSSWRKTIPCTAAAAASPANAPT